MTVTRAEERRRLHEILRGLTRQPFRADDREVRDSTGRPANVWLADGFRVVFRVDHLLKEVSVFGVERVSGR